MLLFYISKIPFWWFEPTTQNDINFTESFILSLNSFSEYNPLSFLQLWIIIKWDWYFWSNYIIEWVVSSSSTVVLYYDEPLFKETYIIYIAKSQNKNIKTITGNKSVTKGYGKI